MSYSHNSGGFKHDSPANAEQNFNEEQAYNRVKSTLHALVKNGEISKFDSKEKGLGDYDVYIHINGSIEKVKNSIETQIQGSLILPRFELNQNKSEKSEADLVYEFRC